MYSREIIKRPFKDNIVSSFLTSNIEGIGIKNKKLYKCYSNEFVYDWMKSWELDGNPENYHWHYITNTNNFDWYINFKEHIIE